VTERDGRTYASLTSADLDTLAALLRNEADMAYRRRTPILMDYLELEDGDRVLDCGCGMGFQLLAMSSLRRLRLTGLDPDRDRLARARAEGIDAELVAGDAADLPFADSAFDKVLLTEVLEHVPDDGRALAGLHRVLAPGGVLAISVPNARWPFWWDPINRVWMALGGRPIRGATIAGIWSLHERLYTREELEAAVRGAGFEVETVEETTHYAFPFSHFLVYSIGKPLLERGLLPDTLARSADRFRGRDNRGRLVNPVNAGRAVLRLVDRLNDRPGAARKRTYVNVLLKARKPRAA
jgi:ubiquinone/menaquinone biosynthesis C-methylase UbiE